MNGLIFFTNQTLAMRGMEMDKKAPPLSNLMTLEVISEDIISFNTWCRSYAFDISCVLYANEHALALGI